MSIRTDFYCKHCEAVMLAMEYEPCIHCGKETEPLEFVENYKSTEETFRNEAP